jgi:hypothetical protein
MDDIEVLSDIRDSLDDIKATLLLVNAATIEAEKKRLLKPGSEERKIYDLCEEGKTNEELSVMVGKPPAYVRSVISTIRKKGLIKTVEHDGKKIHQQRF